MERVWRRVQSAGRRGAAAATGTASKSKPSSAAASSAPQQQHVLDQQQQQQQPEQQQQQLLRGSQQKRKSRGPQTIVCGCQVQPCPVHPVIIRVRRSQRPPPPNCDCPQDKQPCPHAARPAGPRRLRRCDCTERPCRHVATSTRRRPQGLSSLFATSSAAAATVLQAGTGAHPHCPHGDDEVCDCQTNARPCLHTVHKSGRPRRVGGGGNGGNCDCPNQPCQTHRALEGRIKRVKCRVRRAGCAMARCTAELAMLHLHWELASECAPCRPRALTRRLCRRQQSDNELYRSNSFKFERFERSKDECPTPLRKQVSLCDDYSLPVDFVNKKRPVSVAAPTTTVQWTIPSPTVETAPEIEVVEQYSDPKDSKNRAYVEPGAIESAQPTAIYAKANRNYCRPYTDPSASGSSCEDEEITGRLSSARKRKNTVYAASTANRNPSLQERDRAKPATSEACISSGLEHLALVQPATSATAAEQQPSPTESLPSRHPSPYYYGDLFKAAVAEHHHRQYPPCRTQPSKYRKSSSLDVPAERTRSLGVIPKRNSLTGGDGGLLPPYELPYHPRQQQQQQQQQQQEAELEDHNEDDDVPEPEPEGPPLALSPLGSDNASNGQPEILSRCIITEWDYTLMPPHRLLSHDLPTTVCTCLASAEEDEIEPPPPQPQHAAARPLSARHKVRKLRRSRRVEPQPILLEDRADEAELEDEGDEEDENDDEEEDEEMARQRQIYETAFDCKVSRSDDDLDDLDRMTNHPLLISQLRNSSTAPLSRASSSTESSRQSQQTLSQTSLQPSKDHRRSKVVLLRPKALIPSRLSHSQQQQQQQAQPQSQQSDNISSLSQDIESLQINSNDEKSGSPRSCPRGYTPSPPSTAPLPAKFHNNREQLLLNIRSAPNLPTGAEQQQQQQQQRIKDMRLPVKSLRAKEHSPQSSENSILEIKSRPKSFVLESKDLILEFKGRPASGSESSQQQQQQQSQQPVSQRPRPRSLIRDSKPIMEFKGRPHEAEATNQQEAARARREQQASLLEFKLRTSRRRPGYSSTESMATSSSGGSMESLRSSTSEGNRSTSSSESRHSTSLSSHSSDSGSANCFHHHHHHQQSSSLSSFLSHHATKLHILSPISDKSSQEPASETSDNNRNNNSQKASPEELICNPPAENNLTLGSTQNSTTTTTTNATTPTDTSFKKRRTPQNKNLINLALQSSSSGDAEIQGSDSGISIESRAGIKCNKPFGFQPLKLPAQQQPQQQLDNINQMLDNEQELSDLPFDMPKLRRRRLLMQQDATTSGSATSVDLKDLPFDMPKLRRRLRCTQSTESSASQASSSQSVRDVEPPTLFGGGMARPKMTLNLDGGNGVGPLGGDNAGNGQQQLALKKPGGLNLGLSLELTASRGSADLVDVELPLERQGWYHGSITRIEAEAVLRLLREGSYLVRNSESTKQDYSLSLKSARGFMHMRIQKNEELNAYILGQFSKPFDSIPEMVRHFSINRLPIRGAEHMCLLHPVIAQLL